MSVLYVKLRSYILSWQVDAISTALCLPPSDNGFGGCTWGVVLPDGNFVSVLYESDFGDSVEVEDKSRSLDIQHDYNGIGYIEIRHLHRYFEG